MSPDPSLAQGFASHLPCGYRLLAWLDPAGAPAALSSQCVYTLGFLVVAGALLHLFRKGRQDAALHRQELALRKELLAYLLFNGSPRTMPAADLGRQVSCLIAVRSSFPRAALLLRDAAGTLTVSGSAGFDDLSVEALNRWGSSVSDPELPIARIATGKHRVATCSFTLPLDRRSTERLPLSSMSCREVHIIPLRTAQGLLGALVVCTQVRSASQSVAKSPQDPELSWLLGPIASLPLADLLQPLEAFALRLTMQLAAPANLTAIWPPRSISRPASHPDRPSRPNRNADHKGRTARTRKLAPSAPEHIVCPPQNVSPAQNQVSLRSALLPSAASLHALREILPPVCLRPERVAGASGRPPAHIWRTSTGLAAI